jgi:hypothetical protein
MPMVNVRHLRPDDFPGPYWETDYDKAMWLMERVGLTTHPGGGGVIPLVPRAVDGRALIGSPANRN